MNLHKLFVPAAFCLCMSPLLPISAHAQEQSLPARTAIYMSGGIGKDEQALMRKSAKDFNLRLEFSAHRDGEFVAGENILIKDASGTPVFFLASAGPMVNVLLPDGRYTVSGSYKGNVETQEVVLRGKEGKNLYFRWKAASAPAKSTSPTT